MSSASTNRCRSQCRLFTFTAWTDQTVFIQHTKVNPWSIFPRSRKLSRKRTRHRSSFQQARKFQYQVKHPKGCGKIRLPSLSDNNNTTVAAAASGDRRNATGEKSRPHIQIKVRRLRRLQPSPHWVDLPPILGLPGPPCDSDERESAPPACDPRGHMGPGRVGVVRYS